jgi:hypothetical protein
MTRSPDQGPVRRGGLLGAILLVLGIAILAAVAAADIGGTPALEAWALMLGLALGPLLLAVGVAAALVGGWLLWRTRQQD